MSENPKVEVISYNIVVAWSYEKQIETCAICRNLIMNTCIECAAGVNKGECTVSWGKCGHAFHTHCIEKWLSSKNVCPLDTQAWVLDNKKV